MNRHPVSCGRSKDRHLHCSVLLGCSFVKAEFSDPVWLVSRRLKSGKCTRHFSLYNSGMSLILLKTFPHCSPPTVRACPHDQTFIPGSPLKRTCAAVELNGATAVRSWCFRGARVLQSHRTAEHLSVLLSFPAAGRADCFRNNAT